MTAKHFDVDLNLRPLLNSFDIQIDMSDCLESIVSTVETVIEVESIDLSRIHEIISPAQPFLNSTIHSKSNIITNPTIESATIPNGADFVTMVNIVESDCSTNAADPDCHKRCRR